MYDAQWMIQQSSVSLFEIAFHCSRSMNNTVKVYDSQLIHRPYKYHLTFAQVVPRDLVNRQLHKPMHYQINLEWSVFETYYLMFDGI